MANATSYALEHPGVGTAHTVRHHNADGPGLRDWLYLRVGLNPSEVEVIERMLRRNEIRRDTFGSGTGKNYPNTFIMRLRRKLAPFEIVIDIRGGTRSVPATYYLTKGNKARLHELALAAR